MTRSRQARTAPTRIALSVRAGVFIAAMGMSVLASAQVRQQRMPPPRFYNRQSAPPPSRPQPQPQVHPQQVQPQQAYRQQQSQPAPIVRPMEQPAQRPAGNLPLVDRGHPAQMAQHLGPWMQAHGNLSPAQQHQALENEPGFHDLQPGEQQRLHNQLTRLNNMPPEQRQRTIQRNEALESMQPAQKKQVTGVLSQLGSLPENRRLAVVRAYKQLRELPPGQSQMLLNSPQYRGQFSDQERSTIGGLVNSDSLLRGFNPQPQVPHD